MSEICKKKSKFFEKKGNLSKFTICKKMKFLKTKKNCAFFLFLKFHFLQIINLDKFPFFFEKFRLFTNFGNIPFSFFVLFLNFFFFDFWNFGSWCICKIQIFEKYMLETFLSFFFGKSSFYTNCKFGFNFPIFFRFFQIANFSSGNFSFFLRFFSIFFFRIN